MEGGGGANPSPRNRGGVVGDFGAADVKVPRACDEDLQEWQSGAGWRRAPARLLRPMHLSYPPSMPFPLTAPPEPVAALPEMSEAVTTTCAAAEAYTCQNITRVVT